MKTYPSVWVPRHGRPEWNAAGRSQTTARVCLQDMKKTVQFDVRLQKMNIGEWQGKLRRDIKAGEVDFFGSSSGLEFYRNTPSGETIDRVAIRCAEFLICLRGPTVVVPNGITRDAGDLMDHGQPECCANCQCFADHGRAPFSQKTGVCSF